MQRFGFELDNVPLGPIPKIEQLNDVCAIEETAGINFSSSEESRDIGVEIQGRRFHVVGMLKKESTLAMSARPLKAMGARRRDILLQFLFEAIFFSLFGGFFGLAVGIVASKFLSSAIEIPAVISAEAIFIGVTFSAAVGIVFGVYPAWKAANLRPIESLRYE